MFPHPLHFPNFKLLAGKASYITVKKKKKSELFFCCHSNEVLYFDEVHGEWLFPLHMEV